MVRKTKAVSLSFIRYKESSVIAKMFSELSGMQSFVVNGVRSAKSKISPSLFQPLTLCELVEYHDEKRDLNRLKEIRASPVLNSIPFSPGKSAIAMFIAEYISKVVHDGQPNAELFALLQDWILALDAQKNHYDAMHIALVWNSLGPLGIMPHQWQDILPSTAKPNEVQLRGLESFFQWIEQGGEAVPVSGAMKQWILDLLVFYIQTHHEGMGNLQSLKVLRQVFS